MRVSGREAGITFSRRLNSFKARGGHVTPRWERLQVAAVMVLSLVLGAATASAADKPAARPGRVPTLYHKSRSFRIPFNVEPADRPRLKEVQLWVSEDSGFGWKLASRTTPDRPSLTFRSTRDAEYWFAVRTLDIKGKLYPSDDETPEPSMKVVVDTVPPSLVFEPDGRRGSLAAVRWEIKDEHLDLKSFHIEYQVEGARDWREVPVSKPALIGSESWDSGTAEPLKVRASVSDKAGNSALASLSLSEGTPTNPGMASRESSEFSNSPAISQIASGPNFSTSDAPRIPGAGLSGTMPDPFSPVEPAPTNGPARNAIVTPQGSGNDPFGGATVSGAEPASGASAPAPEAAVPQTLLLSSPQFPLQYAVEDAGPNGPASVELWVTQDGGRTWFKKADDPDRTSPFAVELGGEGTFGLRVVARSATGLGDIPPMAGDAPHLTVDVDSTAPSVRMKAPIVGINQHVGKVAIEWQASDAHLATKPVMIFWRPDQAGSTWQAIAGPIDNAGKYVWSVPANLPAKVHIRVEVMDTAGNRGFAETAEGSPVLIDRTRPKTRIIGLDPSARTGMGPNARPFR